MPGDTMLRARAAPTVRALWRDEAAPTAVEYGIMVGLIAVVIVLTVGSLGQTVLNDLFQRTADAMP